MDRKFNRLYKIASRPENQIPLDFDKARFVLFSDHHKGDGSAADDFKKNFSLYDSALDYYKEAGYKLIVLGDNEELWENSYPQVFNQYGHLIKKEIDMAIETPGKKKIRIWGNHDKEVSLRRFSKVAKNLNFPILKKVIYKESLCLGKDIFLIHGHQGRFFDDRAWRLSRWAVQFIWKSIQRLFHIGIDGPAENFKLRADLELKYYQWAKKQKLMLICGHTHQAIFASLTHYDRLVNETKEPEKRKETARKEIKRKAIPCYFNTGCCGYTNGITCIEIEKSSIRLIKWQRKGFKRIIIVQSNLKELLFDLEKGKHEQLPFSQKGVQERRKGILHSSVSKPQKPSA